jgi:hypothetical protein
MPEIVKPIEKDEILYARSVIRQMHPLMSRSYSECLPFLSCVFGWFDRDGKEINEEKINLADGDQLKED